MSHATATKTAAKKPAKKKVSAFSTRKVDPAYYWMVVPAAIIFAFFLYLPFLDGVKYSFTNSQGYGDYKFIGLKNYIALFQDNRVGHAYLFTFLIAILITVLINVIALFLSVLLNSKIAFKNGFRAIFFIPYTLSVLVIGYVFKYIFMNPLPELGKALGIKWLSTSLLTNEQLSWIPIVFLAVWQGIAYSVLIYLAGLQTIDDEIYEAAAIDGVNAWQKFWKITFPLIGPFFTINLVLSMKNALSTFDQVVALTEGGPNSSTETVTYLIWKGGLTGGEYSYQTANAVLFFIVLAIIASCSCASPAARNRFDLGRIRNDYCNSYPVQVRQARQVPQGPQDQLVADRRRGRAEPDHSDPALLHHRHRAEDSGRGRHLRPAHLVAVAQLRRRLRQGQLPEAALNSAIITVAAWCSPC